MVAKELVPGREWTRQRSVEMRSNENNAFEDESLVRGAREKVGGREVLLVVKRALDAR